MEDPIQQQQQQIQEDEMKKKKKKKNRLNNFFSLAKEQRGPNEEEEQQQDHRNGEEVMMNDDDDDDEVHYTSNQEEDEDDNDTYSTYAVEDVDFSFQNKNKMVKSSGTATSALGINDDDDDDDDVDDDDDDDGDYNNNDNSNNMEHDDNNKNNDDENDEDGSSSFGPVKIINNDHSYNSMNDLLVNGIGNNDSGSSSTIKTNSMNGAGLERKPRSRSTNSLGAVKSKKKKDYVTRADYWPSVDFTGIPKEAIFQAQEILSSAKSKWLTAADVLMLLRFGELCKNITNVPLLPLHGSVWYYNRDTVKGFRRDGYSWKKKKGSTSVREDHVKLKVGKFPRVYACYVHSEDVATFHRRVYSEMHTESTDLNDYLNVISGYLATPIEKPGVLVHYFDTTIPKAEHPRACVCLCCMVRRGIKAMERGDPMPFLFKCIPTDPDQNDDREDTSSLSKNLITDQFTNNSSSSSSSSGIIKPQQTSSGVNHQRKRRKSKQENVQKTRCPSPPRFHTTGLIRNASHDDEERAMLIKVAQDDLASESQLPIDDDEFNVKGESFSEFPSPSIHASSPIPSMNIDSHLSLPPSIPNGTSSSSSSSSFTTTTTTTSTSTNTATNAITTAKVSEIKTAEPMTSISASVVMNNSKEIPKSRPASLQVISSPVSMAIHALHSPETPYSRLNNALSSTVYPGMISPLPYTQNTPTMQDTPMSLSSTWESSQPKQNHGPYIVDFAPNRVHTSEKLIICFQIKNSSNGNDQSQIDFAKTDVSVRFGNHFTVNADVIQPGVVRCFAPNQNLGSTTFTLIVNGNYSISMPISVYSDTTSAIIPLDSPMGISRVVPSLKRQRRDTNLSASGLASSQNQTTKQGSNTMQIENFSIAQQQQQQQQSVSASSSGSVVTAGIDILSHGHSSSSSSSNGSIDMLNLESMGEEELSAHSSSMHDRIVQLLLDYVQEYPSLRGEVNALDTNGFNLVHYTVLYSKIQLLEKLLCFGGVDPNFFTSSGETALHIAAEMGHPQVIGLLLKYGADATILDSKGRTPHDVAFESEHFEISEILKSSSTMSTMATAATLDDFSKSSSANNNRPRFSSVASTSSLTQSPVRARLNSVSSPSRDDKRIMLLRDALSSLTLRDQFALTLGVRETRANNNNNNNNNSNSLLDNPLSPTSTRTESPGASNSFSVPGITSGVQGGISQNTATQATTSASTITTISLNDSDPPVEPTTKQIELITVPAESKVVEYMTALSANDKEQIEREAKKIQEGVRRWLLRKNLSNIKNVAENAAVALQAAARGTLARKRFQELKQKLSSNIVMSDVGN